MIWLSRTGAVTSPRPVPVLAVLKLWDGGRDRILLFMQVECFNELCSSRVIHSLMISSMSRNRVSALSILTEVDDEFQVTV